MPVAKIAEVTFTNDDRVRDVIHNFDADGFDSSYLKYKGGRPSCTAVAAARASHGDGFRASSYAWGTPAGAAVRVARRRWASRARAQRAATVAA